MASLAASAARASRRARRARRARTARAASAEMAAMAARVASGASIIIDIRQVHGDELARYSWNTLEFFKSEWKNSDGTPWTELPGEKNKWVDVQTILSKLARFEKPTYLIFCRTNELLVDDNFKKRKADEDPYETKPPIRVIDDKQYFYLETHGKHRAIDFDALPEYYRRPGTFYYRAPPGRICSQYGLEYGYIPYDYAMSCFMSGVESVTNPTNDLLQLNGMTIMLRDYSDERCDISVLERSDTSRKPIESKARVLTVEKTQNL